MEKTELAKIIFDKWVSSLKERDRKRSNVQNNFDDLFSELRLLDLSFKEAHDFLMPAIKAHLPNSSVKKFMWAKVSQYSNATESEFIKEWEDDIKSKGTESFFSYFPLKIKSDDEDDEPKMFGNMSAKEYRLQRKHAEAFPRVDLEKLRAQRSNEKFEEINLDDVLGDK